MIRGEKKECELENFMKLKLLTQNSRFKTSANLNRHTGQVLFAHIYLLLQLYCSLFLSCFVLNHVAFAQHHQLWL